MQWLRKIKAKTVLQLRAEGLSGRAIAASQGISRNGVAAVIKAAGRRELDWRQVQDRTDAEVCQVPGFKDREADHLAVEMFEAAIATYGAPQVVHADSGPAMKSNQLCEALKLHGVELSHNRPYVCNDNPFSEAGFRTMKYRPDYPRIFQDLNAARTYIHGYVTWHNNDMEVYQGCWTVS